MTKFWNRLSLSKRISFTFWVLCLIGGLALAGFALRSAF